VQFDDVERMLFSWVGFDEDNETAGMGWAGVKNMTGWIQFHEGDDSRFVAAK
jgi:hypothetical protein